MTYLEKIKKLPPLISAFFLSDKPRYELEKSFYMYNMDDKFIEKIAPKIGLIYINELPLKNLPLLINDDINNNDLCYSISYEINSRIFARFPEYFTNSLKLLEQWQKLKIPPIISEDEAWKKVLENEPWILETEREEREAEKKINDKNIALQSTIKKITIREALEKFSDLGEQLITSNHLKLKSFPEPVRPSIKNWLSDYTFTLGYESHSAMDRGTYLFKNGNSKTLNSLDREKLAYILKSYDENSPVAINTHTKQIIFPRRKTTTSGNGSLASTMEAKLPPTTPHHTVNLAKSQPPHSLHTQWENKSVQPKHLAIPPTKNLNFTSPQKMAYEKQTDSPNNSPTQPQPLRIFSQNTRQNDNNIFQNNRAIPKGNVVNLKE